MVQTIIYNETKERLKNYNLKELKGILRTTKKISVDHMNTFEVQKIKAVRDLIRERSEKEFRENIYKDRLYEKYFYLFKNQNTSDLEQRYVEIKEAYHQDKTLENEVKFLVLNDLLKFDSSTKFLEEKNA